MGQFTLRRVRVMLLPAIGLAVAAHGEAISTPGNITGRFHLANIRGRDCLVTPDGHPFFTLGINHISAVAQRGTADPFTDQYECDWRKVSGAAFTNLTRWGFNTAGYGSPAPLCRMMPYMAASYLEKTSNYLPDSEFFYPDVFDPQVQQEARNKLRTLCEAEQGNPFLIGYYWTDTPQWDLKRSRRTRGTDWVSAIRSLPAAAPGKERYVAFLTRRHGAALPAGYAVPTDSAGTLLDEVFPEIDLTDPQVAADDLAFLRIIAREHYRVIGQETRRLHPGALIFGERYLMHDHPAVVLEAALPYIDVVSIQPGGSEFDGEFFDRLHRQTGRPVLLCDHQFSFATPDYPKTMWKQLESEEAAGRAHARYLKAAAEKPYIIGYHRCQYIDRFAEHAGVLKQGVVRQDGSPYETLLRYIGEANTEVTRRLLEE